MQVNLSKPLAMLITCLILLSTVVSCCKGKPNPNKIITPEFKKIATHMFGQKHVYHSDQLGQSYYLLKLHGSSYEAGFAYGVLMKHQIKQLTEQLWKYYYSLVESEFKFIAKLPKHLQPLGRSLGIKILKGLLIANYYVTKSHTPKRFIAELEGISQGSGVPFNDLIQLNMIPEYTRAGCSILGAWGKATSDGGLIHLRALDWDDNNPMNNYPVIIVYDLKEAGSHPFVNLLWAGFVGSLTGFSEFTGVGEKVRKQKPVKENETRIGKPWTYALRDTLQFSYTIDEAVESLNKTRRTCSIWVGISNAVNNTFRLIQYSFKQFHVYDEKNFPFTAHHQQMDNVVFYPIHDEEDPCFNDLLKERYGNIDSDWVVNVLAAKHHTGSTQMAVFNFKTKELLFQVSLNKKLSFERPFLRINLANFFLSRYQ